MLLYCAVISILFRFLLILIYHWQQKTIFSIETSNCLFHSEWLRTTHVCCCWNWWALHHLVLWSQDACIMMISMCRRDLSQPESGLLLAILSQNHMRLHSLILFVHTGLVGCSLWREIYHLSTVWLLVAVKVLLTGHGVSKMLKLVVPCKHLLVGGGGIVIFSILLWAK